MNKSRYYCRHFSIGKLKPQQLIWNRLGETISLSYLNIIDFQGKIKSLENIPWFNIPYTEEELQKYSQLIIFNAYKLRILGKIAVADNILIFELIQKMLRVCKLYNNILRSDEMISLYADILHLLFEKKFDDPVSFLNLWKLLCGKSNETKINVLSTLIERRHDKKSLVLLSYILNIAQVAQFNFWGIWFKEDENHLCFCPVTLALLKGNVDHLILLLQYGFEQNPGRVNIYDKYYLHVHPSIYSWLKMPLEERNPRRSAIVTEVLMFLIQFSKVSSKSKLRSLENCFRLLWSVSAVPIVTESELVNEICLRYQSPPRRFHLHSFPYTFKHFINLVDNYKAVKPQGYSNELIPRSLRQLCKCVIRKTLSKSYKLPQGIKELPLPSKLKDFLHVL